jgi:hypothetical protein
VNRVRSLVKLEGCSNAVFASLTTPWESGHFEKCVTTDTFMENVRLWK